VGAKEKKEVSQYLLRQSNGRRRLSACEGRGGKEGRSASLQRRKNASSAVEGQARPGEGGGGDPQQGDKLLRKKSRQE